MHDRSIHSRLRRIYFVSMPVPQPLVNLPKSAIVRIIAIAINSLVPHVAQNTSTFGNRLFLPACSASSGVVVGWTALHFGDFAEFGCIGLLNLMSEYRWGTKQVHWYHLTGRRLPASCEALLGASIEVLPLVESVEVLVAESMVFVDCEGKGVVYCAVSTQGNERSIKCESRL
jgi:hypothetical protein